MSNQRLARESSRAAELPRTGGARHGLLRGRTGAPGACAVRAEPGGVRRVHAVRRAVARDGLGGRAAGARGGPARRRGGPARGVPRLEVRHVSSPILAIDQGTTGTTCLVVEGDLRVAGRGYAELEQHFPRPGWVEHDPEQIWETVLAAAEAALREARVAAGDLRAIGIANQRETTLLWERASGRPVAPAIVWQDRRTAERCRELPAELLRERTGLVPDPYFSATKLEWLLRAHGGSDGLAFGTVDSWLAWKLTRAHVTDVTNASRTLLLDLSTLDWDDELLALFRVDRALLPRIAASAE